jgi:hypothetical protein
MQKTSLGHSDSVLFSPSVLGVAVVYIFRRGRLCAGCKAVAGDASTVRLGRGRVDPGRGVRRHWVAAFVVGRHLKRGGGGKYNVLALQNDL